jgi:hypothetical protein
MLRIRNSRRVDVPELNAVERRFVVTFSRAEATDISKLPPVVVNERASSKERWES